MRKEPFRAWLAKSHSEKATTNRVSRAGRVERALGVLGLPHADLDEAFDRDRLEGVIAALRSVIARARQGERPPPPLVQTSRQPEKQILSLMNAIQNYRRFREDGSPGQGSWPALERMKAVFLDRAPDFEDFEQREGVYWEMERQYKDAMVQQARSIASSVADDAQAGHAIYDVLIPQDGPPLRWQTIDAIHKGDRALAAQFDAALGRLARSGEPVADAIVNAAGELATLRQQGVPHLAVGEILAIVFGISAATRPDHSAFFKIRKAQNLLKRLDEPPLFRGDTIGRQDVDAWLDLLARIFLVMLDEWRWKPRDLLDVQGFAWAVLDERWNALDDDDEAPDPVPNPKPGTSVMPETVNLILYGPPGTGKTYRTAAEAVKLCDGLADDDGLLTDDDRREELMARYRTLLGDDRIGFVTFHQNYSYEDFVEGLRPTTLNEDGVEMAAGFRLQPEPGAFRKYAELAEALSVEDDAASFPLAGRKFFKMSLGEAANPADDYLFDEAIGQGFLHMGDDSGIDWSEPRFDTKMAMVDGYAEKHPDRPILSVLSGAIEFPFTLRHRVRIGDIIIVSKGNLTFRAIGEVTGDYQNVERDDDYTIRRAVKWHWVNREGLSYAVINNKRFSQRTVYELAQSELKIDAIQSLLDSSQESERSPDGGRRTRNFVLIIDEINRANISKVFGELITLIEPDKRIGRMNELRVHLPYSKKQFGVPANLHMIGTMNTADRSIALLDTALRRRFVFKEIGPDPRLLPDMRDGVPLRRVLETINDRIEYLVDREHRIGHAFFMGDAGKDRGAIDAVMRDKIIPLLQEYFFEDWGRVAAVLGEPENKGGGFLDCRMLADPAGQGREPRPSLSVRAVFAPDAYHGLVHGRAAEPPAGADE